MMLYFSPLDKSWPGTLGRATGGGVVDLQRNMYYKTDISQGTVGATHEGFTCRGGREGEGKKKVGERERDGERERRVSREKVLLVNRNLCIYRFPQTSSLTIHETEEEHFESV